MNKEQLKKDIGKLVRLRPYPRLVRYKFPENIVLSTGLEALPQRTTIEVDYDWRIEDVSDDGVTLHCLHTGHAVTLGADNVREYRTSNHLMLKCQLTLDGEKVRIDPF